MSEQQFNAILKKIEDCYSLLIESISFPELDEEPDEELDECLREEEEQLTEKKAGLERTLNRHKDFLFKLPQEYAIEEDLAKYTTSSLPHPELYNGLILAYQYAYEEQHFPYDHPYFKVIKRIFELLKEEVDTLDRNLWWIKSYAWFLDLLIKLEEEAPASLNVVCSNMRHRLDDDEGQPWKCEHSDESMTAALFELITKRRALFQENRASRIIEGVFFHEFDPMIYVQELLLLSEKYPFLSGVLLTDIMGLETEVKNCFLDYLSEWTVQKPLSEFLRRLEEDEKKYLSFNSSQLLFVKVIRSSLSREQVVSAEPTCYEYRPDILAILSTYPYKDENSLLEPLDILNELVKLVAENPDASYENHLHILGILAEKMNLADLRTAVGYLNILCPYCPALKENSKFLEEIVCDPECFLSIFELATERKITADQIEEIYLERWHKYHSKEEIMEELNDKESCDEGLATENLSSDDGFSSSPVALRTSSFFRVANPQESCLSMLKRFLSQEQEQKNIYKSILLEILDGEDKIFIGDEMIDAFSQEKQPEMNEIIRQHSRFESMAEFLSALKETPREVISRLACEQPGKGPQNR